jgi:hypothetical protein
VSRSKTGPALFETPVVASSCFCFVVGIRVGWCLRMTTLFAVSDAFGGRRRWHITYKSVVKLVDKMEEMEALVEKGGLV